MPRAIWTGSISFGLVQIPVGLYSAEEPHDLSFRMLDQRNMAPVKYERVNSETGEPVPYDQIVKGYEYSKGEYVVLEPEDFKAANVEATQTIDIVQFVDFEEIASYFFERPYYLAPPKKGAKAYALLRETLRESGKVGVAKVVIRTRQHLVALIVEGDVLILDQLRWAHEIRPPDQLDLPSSDLSKAGVTKRELQMAQMLVNSMVDEWDPTKFRDEYYDDLMALIERKRETGKTEVIHPPDPEREAARKAKVVDIMELLQKSLGKGAGKKELPRRAAAKVAKKSPAAAKAKKSSAKAAKPRKKRASAGRK